MAKEEKPLEYQHRIRDTKGVAQRLDLEYLKHPALLAILRQRLTWVLVAAAVLVSVPLMLGVGGSKRTLSSGPLSRAHAVFEGRCEVCHAQAFRSIPDAACERCHDGAGHPAKALDVGKSNRTPPCVECHVEHRGKTLLADVVSGNCTSCHANLTSHATGVKVRGTEIKAFREGKHPEFSPAGRRDLRPMQLNHAIHMPAEAKTIRGMKLPMKCDDCHAMDRNSADYAMFPVTFEKHCKSCHARELQFDIYQVLGPEAPPSPHTRDARVIQELVAGTYKDAIAKDSGLLQRQLGRDLNPQPNAAAWLERVTKDSLDFLFEKKCTYCHQADSYAVMKKVDPIAGHFPEATPWIERGEFSHRAHRAVECDSCHAAARASKRTEDVLIPTMKTCLPCHGDSRAGLDRCSECHRYHNRTIEKEKERRPTEVLVGSSRQAVPLPPLPGAVVARTLPGGPR